MSTRGIAASGALQNLTAQLIPLISRCHTFVTHYLTSWWRFYRGENFIFYSNPPAPKVQFRKESGGSEVVVVGFKNVAII
jgi:hypothetical protein